MQIKPEFRERASWREALTIAGVTVILIGYVFLLTSCASMPCELAPKEPHPEQVDEDGEPVTLNVRCPQ